MLFLYQITSWLIDRLATMSNIAGDLAVTAVVSNKVSGSSNGIMMMADDDEKDEVDTLFAADLWDDSVNHN